MKNTISKLQAEFKKAITAHDEAKAKFNRLALAKSAGAPEVTFEEVGRAACESLLTETEMKEAQKDLVRATARKQEEKEQAERDAKNKIRLRSLGW